MGIKENASKGLEEIKKEAEVIKGEKSKDICIAARDPSKMLTPHDLNLRAARNGYSM